MCIKEIENYSNYLFFSSSLNKSIKDCLINFKVSFLARINFAAQKSAERVRESFLLKKVADIGKVSAFVPVCFCVGLYSLMSTTAIGLHVLFTAGLANFVAIPLGIGVLTSGILLFSPVIAIEAGVLAAFLAHISLVGTAYVAIFTFEFIRG